MPSLLTELGLSHYISLFESRKITTKDLIYNSKYKQAFSTPAYLHREKLESLGVSPLSCEKLRLRGSCLSFDNVMISGVLAKEEIGRGAYGVVCFCGTHVLISNRFTKAFGKATLLLQLNK